MDIICFSHLRWDFVFQRPQHLLTRLAANFRIFYIEEAVFDRSEDGYTQQVQEGVHIVNITLKGSHDAHDRIERQQKILASMLSRHSINHFLLWFYTPMALPIAAKLRPVITVYDCMDELSAFRFAPPELKKLERELMNKADIVFTGGLSLYSAKKDQHRNIHAFPSSIDKQHFQKARGKITEPKDQAAIPHPRLGFYGVIDERFDHKLIGQIAKSRPEWQIVLLGPIAKIDPAILPSYPNIHYLGGKTYAQLPLYLAGWDIALITFALNKSTRFISPTKTPEYLAGGKPVISTPITDVVESYGKAGLVHIASTAKQFTSIADQELAKKNKSAWLKKVDKYLLNISWDHTVKDMRNLLYQAIARKQIFHGKKKDLPVVNRYVMEEESLPAAS